MSPIFDDDAHRLGLSFNDFDSSRGLPILDGAYARAEDLDLHSSRGLDKLRFLMVLVREIEKKAPDECLRSPLSLKYPGPKSSDSILTGVAESVAAANCGAFWGSLRDWEMPEEAVLDYEGTDMDRSSVLYGGFPREIFLSAAGVCSDVRVLKECGGTRLLEQTARKIRRADNHFIKEAVSFSLRVK